MDLWQHMPASVPSDRYKTDWGNESHSELSRLEYFKVRNVHENVFRNFVIL